MERYPNALTVGRVSQDRYYRWIMRHSPNRRTDRRAFESIGRIMIERAAKTERTPVKQAAARNKMAIRWQHFVRSLHIRMR